jgi:transcriptional regulator with XRE-family HTH domain
MTMADDRYQARSWGERLRAWREEVKQWSRAEFTDELEAASHRIGEGRGQQLDERLIAQWETGAVRPQAFHRRVLAHLGAPLPAAAEPIKRRSLARARKVAGFSQEGLAEHLGVDRTTVARWEAGESEPQPYQRPRIGKAFGLSLGEVNQLLDEAEPQQGCPAGEFASLDDTASAFPPPGGQHTNGSTGTGRLAVWIIWLTPTTSTAVSEADTKHAGAPHPDH